MVGCDDGIGCDILSFEKVFDDEVVELVGGVGNEKCVGYGFIFLIVYG